MTPKIHIIVAIDRNNAIGRRGDLIYHLPADLRRFKALTVGNTVVMGRRTWESLPKALPGRRNIVVTHRDGYDAAGAETAASVECALAMAAAGPGDTYIIGGAQIYAETLPLADMLHLTVIDADTPDADTFFPAVDSRCFRVVDDVDAGTTPPARYVTLEKIPGA